MLLVHDGHDPSNRLADGVAINAFVADIVSITFNGPIALSLRTFS